MNLRITLLDDDNRPLQDWAVTVSGAEDERPMAEGKTSPKGIASLKVNPAQGSLVVALDEPGRPASARTLTLSKATASGLSRAPSAGKTSPDSGLVRPAPTAEPVTATDGAKAPSAGATDKAAGAGASSAGVGAARPVLTVEHVSSQLHQALVKAGTEFAQSGYQLRDVELRLTGPATADATSGALLLCLDAEPEAVSGQGSRFDLKFSLGERASQPTTEAATQQRVPDVVGYGPELARRKLLAEGFTAQVVQRSTAKPEEDGRVLAQRPAAGQPMSAGATVTLQIGQLLRSR